MPPRLPPADPQSVLWTATAPDAMPTEPLRGEAKADVAVVGGGYTGLSAALHLAERGVDVALLEAQDMGFGASGRNNGQVIPTYSRQNPDEMVRKLGPNTGERLNAWVAGTAQLVFDLIAKHDIDCDAAQQGWLQPAHRPGRMAGIRAKYEQWAKRGAPVELLDAERTRELTGSPLYHGAWLHKEGGHIQPLSYARGLARAAAAAGARLHGHSPALSLDRHGDRWRLRTPEGSLAAETVLLATNAYTDTLWPTLKETIIPLRSFHAATAPLGDNAAKTVLPENHGYSDTRQALWAFRKDRDGRLITTAAPLFTAGAVGNVRHDTAARIAKVFPQAAGIPVDYVWEGRIAMTVDRLPRFHELSGGVYAGLGYSGRGIAMATAMGKLLADRATGLAASEVPLPPTSTTPLPMHGLMVPLSRAMVLYYRWKDSRG